MVGRHLRLVSQYLFDSPWLIHHVLSRVGSYRNFALPHSLFLQLDRANQD